MSGKFTYRRLDKAEAAVLLVDHQSGLCNLVGDFSPDDFKNNVLAVADLAKYFKLPTILTTSFEDGPNGPLVPELKELFPEAPYIARPGNINAWDTLTCQGGESDRQETVDHCRRGHRGVRGVSRALGDRRRF